MKENNNIDRIFSEGLANYSEKPPAFVWDAIAGGLQGAKQNKKILFIWRGVAAAAIVGLLFLGGLFWNNSNNNDRIADSRLQQPSNALQQSGIDNMEVHENKANMDKSIALEQEKRQNTKQKQIKSVQKSINVPSNKIKPSENKTQSLASVDKAINEDKQTYAQIIAPIIAETKDIEKSETPLLQKMGLNTVHTRADYSVPNALHLLNKPEKPALKSSETDNFLLAFDNHKPLKASDKKALQFALGGHFSPSYSYNDPGQSDGSTVAAANEDGIISYTGGINLNIKTRKKWEIETGVYYSQIGQKFSNPMIGSPDKMFFAAGPNAGVESKKPNLKNSMGNITLKTSAQQQLIKEVAVSNANTAFRLNSDNFADSPTQVDAITVQQELDYIEIPFLLRYNLLNKSVGLSLSGGMSTNFLIGNSAYRMENNSKNNIGETQGINDISYSAIFGFGFRAPILKSLDFNLEPRFKYFMNSVTDSPGSSYKPYSIGIYTGVSYQF